MGNFNNGGTNGRGNGNNNNGSNNKNNNNNDGNDNNNGNNNNQGNNNNNNGHHNGGNWRNKKGCHLCGDPNHWANQCPNRATLNTITGEDLGEERDVTKFGRQLTTFHVPLWSCVNECHTSMMTQTERVLAAGKHLMISPYWILCDNQSSVDIIKNRSLVSNIRTTKNPIRVFGIGGSVDVMEEGDLAGYGVVYVHDGALANILSYAHMVKRFANTEFNMQKYGNKFVFTQADGSILEFNHSQGLYYHDVRHGRWSGLNNAHALVSSVAENESLLPEREVKEAQQARRLFQIMALPSFRDYEYMLAHKLILNCPVTYADAKRADAIYGKDVGALAGRTIRSKPLRVVFEEAPALSKKFLELFGEVQLCIDFMFLDGIPFLVTVSRRIKLITTMTVPNRKMESVRTCIQKTLDVYAKRGFVVTHIIGDGEFHPLIAELEAMKITLNTTAQNEHVPEIENANKMIKSRVRGIIATWPYTKVPNAFKIACVQYCVFYINMTPKKASASRYMSPREIVDGTKLDFNKHCRIPFGQYCHVHEDRAVTNTMLPRTTGAIAFGPSGNAQGAYKFFSLTTGRTITRRKFIELPITSDVIEQVAALAKAEKHTSDEFLFKFGNGDDVPDLGNESDTEDDHDDGEDDPFIEPDDLVPPHITGAETDDKDDDIEDEDEADDDEHHDDDDSVTDDTDADVATDIIPDNSVNEGQQVMKDNVIDLNEVERVVNTKTHSYNLRPKTPKNWSYLFAVLLHTFSVKTGLKECREETIQALLAELGQFVKKGVIAPVHYNQLTHKQKRKILRMFVFMKRKRDGRLKARAVADGSMQEGMDSQVDPSSPTVSLEALILSCVADAVEKRVVVTADIEGAYLEVLMTDEVFAELNASLVPVMIELDPSYAAYVVNTPSGPKIYVRLVKALYGCVQSARLFYEHLSKTLMDYGFRPNPYDPCVFNKMYGEYQCTVVIYVDDLKISCVDGLAVADVIKYLSSVYTKINATYGRTHSYLGMELDYSETGFVKISMRDMVEEAIKCIEEPITGSVLTPANYYLFDVRTDAKKLEGPRKELFHTCVAKLLYIGKRARPDILTAICFLATRVTASDEDDWKKLKRVLTYLNGTKDLGLRLSANSMTLVDAYADASYAVHKDMKSQTGTVITFGQGAVYSKSTKQKLVSKSSTEAELIGLTDSMSQILWTRYFLQEQGYDIGAVRVYQDNRSAMLLAEKGVISSSRRTRHINIRYFFVKDRVDSGEVKIVYKPTEDMLADFFTKPLQGVLFVKLRDAIMNPSAASVIASQERVGARSAAALEGDDATPISP
jgi:hypothetical protein